MVETPDVIGVLVAVFAASVTLLGGMGGMFAFQSRRLDARFDKIDARFDKIDARFERVEAELTDVKIAIARVEGPQPRLLRP